MMKTMSVVSATIITAMMATTVSAADVKHGEKLARQWCSGCHVIDTDQSAGGDTAPTFAAIAETAAERTNELSAWLADPHPPMPNLSLTHYEIDDLLAFIESLGSK